ncbi:MAG TPA: beta-galactosidase GalA [Bryobacteraceae bacterium]|nr:beta-galactosidase GalA [Bryobacteraceae bacterium]
MKNWTRRDLLKSGMAASALAAAGQGGGAAQSGAAAPAGAASAKETAAIHGPRERLLLDFGWRFHLGNADDAGKDFGLGANGTTFAKSGGFIAAGGPTFDDSSWEKIDLPHDWAIELPFVNERSVVAHGCKPLGRGFPETSIGWYRRVFDLPASDLGRRIALEFDGVFRDSMVIFNGHYIGENFSGYAPFRFDVTDFANYGSKNVLLLRADATLNEGWFYEGAGIYRHVWLTKTDPLHVAHWGTFVRSQVRPGSATVLVTTEVDNDSGGTRACRIISRIRDARDKVVATATSANQNVAAWGRAVFEQRVAVNRPALWSLEEPTLYQLETAIETGGSTVDRYVTPFGIRTVRFDADRGFFLNDKPVKIKGTCNHQDHAGVGAALPDRIQSYRIERLKDMGSNGYRTSHNPPTPELLDACDRLGMLVMDETRMMSSNPEGLSQLERLIRRDRNHPSVVIWSLGNEEREQGTERGFRILTTMKRLTYKLDGTRLCTVAMNGAWGKGISNVIDVQGCNYQNGDFDAYHKEHPKQPMIGTETASTVSTRGIYENDPQKGYVSAYDKNFPRWASTAETWWKIYDARPFLSGGFAWTGFDYRGEPTPYRWPCINSHFGIMDTCGFPKDNFFYYQAWWGSKPVLHLFPHWNWAGKEGQEIEVWAHSNLDRVELFLNGKSLGSQAVEKDTHLVWKVKYAPGTIEARGFKGNEQVLTAKRETTGPAVRLVLRPDRARIAGDGEDVSMVAVEVVDAQGRTVPTADNEITFQVSGSGKMLGVGNGDPSCHDSDKGPSRHAFNGLGMVIVQAAKQAGTIRVEAAAPGLEGESVTIDCEAAPLRLALA